MNRKELVQRWRNALGYGQKEMFYYPVKSKKEEPKICNKLTINTFFYKYYDIETKLFEEKGDGCYAQVLIKNNKTSEIIYCNKSSRYYKSISVYNLPYGEYSVRVISLKYGMVDNIEHIVNVNSETISYDILSKHSFITIEQYEENRPINYYISQNQNGEIAFDDITIIGGVKFKYFDNNGDSLSTSEFFPSYYSNTMGVTTYYTNENRHGYVGLAYEAYTGQKYFSFNINCNNSSKINETYTATSGSYILNKETNEYMPYVFDINNVTTEPEQCTFVTTFGESTYTYNYNGKIEVVKKTFASQNSDLSGKYIVFPSYYSDNFYNLNTIEPSTFNIAYAINRYCEDYCGDKKYNKDTINEEWYDVGANNFSIKVTEAAKGLIIDNENHSEIQDGYVLHGSNGTAWDSIEKINDYIAYIEEQTGGKATVEYYYTDLPSFINTDSSLLTHIIKTWEYNGGIQLNRGNVVYKYKDKYFRTVAMPLKISSQEEIFLVQVYCNKDVVDDYKELPWIM